MVLRYKDRAAIHAAKMMKRGAYPECRHRHRLRQPPSGNPEPSVADLAITARIKQALELVEVRLLDHIVVGADGTASLALRGWV